MKTSLILFVFFVLTTSLTALAHDQDSEKGKGEIGMTFSSLGNVDYLSFAKSVGGPGYRGNGYNAVGLNYIYRINKTFDFETGIEYSAYKIIIEPNLPDIYHGVASLAKFSLINIPASVRLNFLRFFFLNGGAFFDVNAGDSGNIGHQGGIGANLGIGCKYDFNCGWSIFVNPYTKVHSIIPISASGSQGRLIESGFRFGLLYRLKK